MHPAVSSVSRSFVSMQIKLDIAISAVPACAAPSWPRPNVRRACDRNDADINDAVGHAKRQRHRRFSIKLGGLAHPFDRLDHTGTGALAHDTAQAGQQAVERAEPLRWRSTAAGKSIDPLPDQLIDAEERHNGLHAGDGDTKLALEAAGGVDRERAGAA